MYVKNHLKHSNFEPNYNLTGKDFDVTNHRMYQSDTTSSAVAVIADHTAHYWYVRRRIYSIGYRYWKTIKPVSVTSLGTAGTHDRIQEAYERKFVIYERMGAARICVVWGAGGSVRQSQGHRGAKQGMSLGHLAIHGDMRWGQLREARAQGGSCPPPR